MQKYIEVLKRTRLFAGVADADIEAMLGCLAAAGRSYQKGEYALHAGEPVSSLLILLEGSLHIQTDDYWGNRAILGNVAVGEVFGEAYIAGGIPLNDVVAVENSIVLCLDVQRLLSVCSSACKFHLLAVKNLFFALADKNRKLVAKLGYLSNRTTREKLLSYLSDEAKRSRSASFVIPYNRQQLADFLSVDRSAMSAELSKMRDDGLIAFHKNQFTLL